MTIRERIIHYFTGEDMGWARFVSDILSPPMVWGLLALPIAFRDAESPQQAMTWALIYIVLVCILPLIYIGWMIKKGKITDIHLKVREQRIRPFLVSMLTTTIAWWTLRFLGAPSVLPMLALFSLIQMALMAMITLVWQISMHTMSISGAVMALGIMFGAIPALITMPLVFVVGAARLKLQRHTVAQVVGGVVLGVLVPLVMLNGASV